MSVPVEASHVILAESVDPAERTALFARYGGSVRNRTDFRALIVC
jgi:hypothetical protein